MGELLGATSSEMVFRVYAMKMGHALTQLQVTHYVLTCHSLCIYLSLAMYISLSIFFTHLCIHIFVLHLLTNKHAETCRTFD